MSNDDSEGSGERVVRCPVEGCTAEKLARGIHLHILRSVGDNHGEQGEYPGGVTLDDLEEVGREEVAVNYPEERETETVARLCPYCGDPFKGKEGVMIHLGQMAGRKNHPPNASKVHEPTDFAVVELDDDENITSVVSRPRGEDREDTGDGAADDDVEPSARFTKDEIAALFEVMAEAGVEDERLRLMLQRKFLKSLNRDG
jgi:hypothetical protein